MPRRLLILLTAVTFAACSSAPPVTGPPAVALPSRSGPVRGEASIDVVSSSAGPIVFHNRAAPPPDDAAIAEFATGLVGWLDRHLSDLQAGGAGILNEVAAPGLLTGAPAEPVTAVGSALASPQRRVARAFYHVVVAQEGPPLWARVNVTVQTVEGAPAQAAFVFTPGPPLALVALQGPPSGASP